MNTPSHLILSLFVWRRQSNWLAILAISFGALLPDLPMIGFYFYEKFILGTPESVIWSAKYYQDDWQLFFDIFNSIPLFLLLILIGYFFNLPILCLLASSALLHLIFDLFLHHDDAHRHFLPFSNWQFHSPVSYWDARFYGDIFMRFEFIASGLACLIIGVNAPAKKMRIIAWLALISLAGFGFFTLLVWH